MNRFNHKTLELAEHHPEGLSTINYYNLTVKSESEVAGSQFHLVMQQIGLGLAVEPLLKEYPQINNWVDKVKPFINILGNKQWSAQLQYLYHDILLYSECDLIIYGENQVVGFDTKEQAEKFRDWLVRKNKCSSAVIRHSERLATEWEVKTWNVPTSLILKCAVKDLKESSNATISTESVLQRG